METILFIVIILVYVAIKRISEKRMAYTRVISDEECLLHLARLNSCSELDLFRKAAVFWTIPEIQVDDDFKSYLLGGILPHYVRDFIRKNPLDRDQLQQLIHNTGGIFYPSWKA